MKVTKMKATPQKAPKARAAGKSGQSRAATKRVPKRVAGNVR